MTRMPCPSDYRSGDESNPGSPDYIEPKEVEGKTPVEFAWTFYFDPPHPAFGEECQAILSGDALHTDTYPPLTRAERRSMRSADDEPSPERGYEGFEMAWAELPDGRRLGIEQLAAEPGFGTRKDQIDDFAPELREHAEEACESFVKAKRECAALRSQWIAARAPAPGRPSPA